MIAVGQRVRVVREERGLTQHALSELTGVTTDMISRLENGRYTTPGLRTLFRIADGMGLTVSALLPDAAPIAPLTPEALLRARLATLGHRARPADLELIVELVPTIVNRGR